MDFTPKKPPTEQISANAGSLSFKMDLPQQNLVTCDVCGHQNPPDVGLCVMCSAYLFKMSKK